MNLIYKQYLSKLPKKLQYLLLKRLFRLGLTRQTIKVCDILNFHCKFKYLKLFTHYKQHTQLSYTTATPGSFRTIQRSYNQLPLEKDFYRWGKQELDISTQQAITFYCLNLTDDIDDLNTTLLMHHYKLPVLINHLIHMNLNLTTFELSNYFSDVEQLNLTILKITEYLPSSSKCTVGGTLNLNYQLYDCDGEYLLASTNLFFLDNSLCDDFSYELSKIMFLKFISGALVFIYKKSFKSFIRATIINSATPIDLSIKTPDHLLSMYLKTDEYLVINTATCSIYTEDVEICSSTSYFIYCKYTDIFYVTYVDVVLKFLCIYRSSLTAVSLYASLLCCVNVESTNLTVAHIDNCFFYYVTVSQVQCFDATYLNLIGWSCVLSYTMFFTCVFVNCSFNDSSLINFLCQGVEYTHVVFKYVNFRYGSFFMTSFKGILYNFVMFSEVKFYTTLINFSEFYCVQFTGGIFVDCVFSGTTLTYVDFVNCTFVNVIFNETIFKSVTFQKCTFSAVIFKDVTFYDTSLVYLDMDKVLYINVLKTPENFKINKNSYQLIKKTRVFFYNLKWTFKLQTINPLVKKVHIWIPSLNFQKTIKLINLPKNPNCRYKFLVFKLNVYTMYKKLIPVSYYFFNKKITKHKKLTQLNLNITTKQNHNLLQTYLVVTRVNNVVNFLNNSYIEFFSQNKHFTFNELKTLKYLKYIQFQEYQLNAGTQTITCVNTLNILINLFSVVNNKENSLMDQISTQKIIMCLVRKVCMGCMFTLNGILYPLKKIIMHFYIKLIFSINLYGNFFRIMGVFKLVPGISTFLTDKTYRLGRLRKGKFTWVTSPFGLGYDAYNPPLNKKFPNLKDNYIKNVIKRYTQTILRHPKLQRTTTKKFNAPFRVFFLKKFARLTRCQKLKLVNYRWHKAQFVKKQNQHTRWNYQLFASKHIDTYKKVTTLVAGAASMQLKSYSSLNAIIFFSKFFQLTETQLSNKTSNWNNTFINYYLLIFSNYWSKILNIKLKLQGVNLSQYAPSEMLLDAIKKRQRRIPRLLNILYPYSLYELFYLALLAKDLSFLKAWILEQFLKHKFKHYHIIRKFLFSFLLKYFWKFRQILELKGLFIEFRGKLQKRGARKKVKRKFLGKKSLSQKNLRTVFLAFPLATDSGAVNCKIILFY